jgi:VWFA-related protein
MALAGVALAALVAAPPVVPGAEDGAPIAVFLDRPDPTEPVFGEVTVEAVVVAQEAIRRVVFYLDGVVVGELTEPPYVLSLDAGARNEPRRFEVLAYGESGATGAASVVTPPVKVDEEVAVTLTQLFVTVTDPQGQRVTGLSEGDFRILDEGAPRRVLTFARGDIPFTAVVLLDSSRSMEGAKLEAAVAGAAAFFRGMRRLDEGRLLVFSDRVLLASPVTTFPEVLTAGLSRVQARGGSALTDHLYLALKQLEERQGRRVVVLLSDGVDSHSVLDMEEVLNKTRRSQAILYWLRLPYGERPAEGQALPQLRSAWRRPEDYRRQFGLLERAVAESGGRVVVLASPEDIEPAFQGILAELREQYVLGFQPEGLRRDGRWRRVRVEVQGPGLAARSQGGYVDLRSPDPSAPAPGPRRPTPRSLIPSIPFSQPTPTSPPGEGDAAALPVRSPRVDGSPSPGGWPGWVGRGG